MQPNKKVSIHQKYKKHPNAHLQIDGNSTFSDTLTLCWVTVSIGGLILLAKDFWGGSRTAKNSEEDYVPVDTLSDTHKLFELLTSH